MYYAAFDAFIEISDADYLTYTPRVDLTEGMGISLWFYLKKAPSTSATILDLKSDHDQSLLKMEVLDVSKSSSSVVSTENVWKSAEAINNSRRVSMFSQIQP